jgi:hypothetical protein
VQGPEFKLQYYKHIKKTKKEIQNLRMENKMENPCLDSWVWWYTPVILTTWEAEFRRLVVQGWPRQKGSETPSPPLAGCSDMHLLSHAPQDAEIRKIVVQAQAKKIHETPI